MELSKNIGKPVFSPAGENLGYVTGALLRRDLSEVAAYVCAGEEEEDFYLPVSGIRASNDALIAVRTREGAPSGLSPCPVGKRAYSSEGEDLGVITDFLFGDDAPVFLLSKDGVAAPVSAKRLLIGETVLVYPTAAPKKPVGVKRTKKTAAKKPTPEKSAPLPPLPVLPSAKAPVTEELPAAEHTAQEDWGRFNLLGRQVKKAVFDGQGFLIANAGERVTREILLKARRHNRLLELTVNTLTNIW